MVVGPGIRTSYDHDGCITLEETEIADGGFEEVTVLLKPKFNYNLINEKAPFREVDGRGEHFDGELSSWRVRRKRFR